MYAHNNLGKIESGIIYSHYSAHITEVIVHV